MQPILHLSLPVRDLAEAQEFYVETLGCLAARTRPGFADVWFFGMQITLQDRPDEVTPLHAEAGRHFGVTLARDEFDEVVARLLEHEVRWLVPVSTDDPGTPVEQTKTKLADPSGNVIELKTYVDVAAALEISAHSYPAALEHGN
jgi:extradiol dioxygenase family protein